MRFTATVPTPGRLGIDAASVPELPVAPPAATGTPAQAPDPVLTDAASTPAATPIQPPESLVAQAPCT
ncbi:MAG: hypothetical protein ABL982_13920 [Vicinamibacterales bacterium]